MGVVHWDQDSRVNIVCFADLILRYRITYDSTVEDTFYVHTDKGIIKFLRYGKLYGYRVSRNYLNPMAKLEGYERPTKQPTTEASHAVPTVADNRKGFTNRQFKDAKAARDLKAMLGFPTTANFKHIIRLNQIRNCPITLKDIENAEKIFGDNIASPKGKSTRQKPPVIKEDFIEIPPEFLEHNK